MTDDGQLLIQALEAAHIDGMIAGLEAALTIAVRKPVEHSLSIAAAISQVIAELKGSAL